MTISIKALIRLLLASGCIISLVFVRDLSGFVTLIVYYGLILTGLYLFSK